MSAPRRRAGICWVCGDRAPDCWVDRRCTLCGLCVDIVDWPELEAEPEPVARPAPGQPRALQAVAE